MGCCNCKCVSTEIVTSPRETEEIDFENSFKDIDLPSFNGYLPTYEISLNSPRSRSMSASWKPLNLEMAFQYSLPTLTSPKFDLDIIFPDTLEGSPIQELGEEEF